MVAGASGAGRRTCRRTETNHQGATIQNAAAMPHAVPWAPQVKAPTVENVTRKRAKTRCRRIVVFAPSVAYRTAAQPTVTADPAWPTIVASRTVRAPSQVSPRTISPIDVGSSSVIAPHTAPTTSTRPEIATAASCHVFGVIRERRRTSSGTAKLMRPVETMVAGTVRRFAPRSAPAASIVVTAAARTGASCPPVWMMTNSGTR